MGTIQKYKAWVQKQLRILYPNEEIDKQIRLFYRKKVKLIAVVCLLSCMVAFLYTLLSKEQDEGVRIIQITGIIAVVILIEHDYSLKRQVERRNTELVMEYPNIIAKLSMLMGAGFTMRKAWMRISSDYLDDRRKGKKHNYAYEEMVRSYFQMDSGLSEGQVYEQFGRRCQLQIYRRFSLLLVQNLHMGNQNLLVILHAEAKEAFLMRREKALRIGEEAQTKLLGPMMLILLTVLVIIVIPAFSAMGI